MICKQFHYKLPYIFTHHNSEHKNVLSANRGAVSSTPGKVT